MEGEGGRIMPISEVYNIDCMEYMKSIPDKFFHLAVVDPPYGIGASEMTMGKGKNKKYQKGKGWDPKPPDDKYFSELFRVSHNQIIWGGNYFINNLTPTRCFIIWDKQQPESLSFASCEFAWTNYDRSAKTFYMRPQNADVVRMHPTQKPISLYAWILKNYAKEGDKILDTHLGSGSSRIAAYKLGFDFYATELDKEYFDAQEERFRCECFGEIKTEKGTLVQTSLFE